MPSSARRGGVELLKLRESASDPAAVADFAFLYTKDVGGVTQAFIRTSAGDIFQITPPGLSAGSTISPASISTNNDYNPASLANATIVRQDLPAVATITGLAGGAADRRVTFININATQANLLTFAHEAAGSAAANRFIMPSALDWIIPIGGSITFVYDGTSSRWRPTNFVGNVFPVGAASNPGLVVGVTPTRGWRDAGTTVRGINGASDITAMGSSFAVTAAFSQSGGQVTTSPGASGFINTGEFSTSASIFSTGDISTTLNGGTVNDWAPGIGSTTTVRTDLTAATIVTGAAGGSDGKFLLVQNISTVLVNTITINHEDAGSVAANRFNLPSQLAAVIPVGGAAAFRYDSTSSRWRLFGFAN